ncbi:MAG: 3-isopropylmalate/(R)-2-methylmalate dehydratase small subunit [Bacteroidia bacterium]|jgi:3-isopropylmalate/(R)-2-methylmalate dehydratase small subunit
MSNPPIVEHRGVAAALLQANIDTDVIIPSREMKMVSKDGLGEGLFANWRYTLPGGREANPDFMLNQDAYRNSSILLCGNNFGCGSSREHAVWALREYGIRVIIAPSFGAIFYNNCINNGLLPIVLDEHAVHDIASVCRGNPQTLQVLINLNDQSVTLPNGISYPFAIEAAAKHILLNGLDQIGLSLQHAADIEAFETKDRNQRGWAYLPVNQEAKK